MKNGHKARRRLRVFSSALAAEDTFMMASGPSGGILLMKLGGFSDASVKSHASLAYLHLPLAN